MRAIDLLHTMLNPVIPRWLRPKKIVRQVDHQQSGSEAGFYHWRFRSRGVFCYLPGRPVLELGLLY